MNRYLSTKELPEVSKVAHPLGTVVFCIHCFQTLGVECGEGSREFLLAQHKCVESMLVKQPSAPPPYN